MKLVTFAVKTPLGIARRLGAVHSSASSTAEEIIDLNHCYANLLHERGVTKSYSFANTHIPSHMLRFINLGASALSEAHEALSWFEHRKRKLKNTIGRKEEQLSFQPKEIKLLAPLTRPRSLRDFMAFEEHTKAGWARRKAPVPQEWYEMPVYYKGSCDSIIGPNDEVIWPSYTEKLDYELEMAAIIGKRGKNITEKSTNDFIFGFMILNDFSARDIQAKEMICRLGPSKGKDFATAIGPHIVTRDEVGNYENLKMTAKINGEIWSSGNSGSRYWSFAKMIEHVSKDEEIFPGDVLGSGTVGGGCGLELEKWIQPGDVVELEIEKLGILKNTIGSKK